jgi:hypothetical protein
MLRSNELISRLIKTRLLKDAHFSFFHLETRCWLPCISFVANNVTIFLLFFDVRVSIHSNIIVRDVHRLGDSSFGGHFHRLGKVGMFGFPAIVLTNLRKLCIKCIDIFISCSTSLDLSFLEGIDGDVFDILFLTNYLGLHYR